MKLVSFYSGEKHLKYSRCFVKTFWLNSNQTLVDWVEKSTIQMFGSWIISELKNILLPKTFSQVLALHQTTTSQSPLDSNKSGARFDICTPAPSPPPVHQHHHIGSNREKRCIGFCIPANQEKDIKSSNFAILLQFFLALNWKVNNFLRSKGINILYFQIA